MINTDLPPRFDVVNPDLNWFFWGPPGSDRMTVSRSPFEIVKTMQQVLGITADGNWGSGTSDAILTALRRSDAPQVLVDAVEAVKSSRSFAGTNGLRAWAVAAYLGMIPRAQRPDWPAVMDGEVALGTTATIGSVALPTYGQVAPGAPAPGSPTTGGRPPVPQPVQPPPPVSLPVVRPDQLSGSSAQQLQRFYEKNKMWFLIGGAVVIAGTGAAIYFAMQDDDAPAGPRRMDTRRAAALLGVPENADPPSIRTAYARSMQSVHPDRGYTGSDAPHRIAELQAARDAMIAHSMKSLPGMGAPSRA